MNQQDLTQEILNRLDALAAKLGTTAEYLWPALVREQYALGWAKVVVSATIVLCAGALWVWVLRMRDVPFFSPQDETRPTRKLGACIAAVVLSAVSFPVATINIPLGVVGIVAPEAAALRAILP